MNTETLKIALFVIVDLLFIAYFLYVVYKLNKRVIELESKLNKKDVVFRISGNYLVHADFETWKHKPLPKTSQRKSI